MSKTIDVLIPAFNEEKSIGHVIKDIPTFVREIVVVNNRSTDKTAEVAGSAGAHVILQEQMGYGSACLKGIEYIANKSNPPDILVFIDGDYSDYPEQISDIIKPIVENDIDFVIGSRAIGEKESGAMMPQQIFGNWLATSLMHVFYKAKFTDLGPFRAIKFDKLMALGMQDKNYGWTIEMQIKAVKNNFTFVEVPVDYRVRIGTSKVSGTVKGTVMAGYKILTSIFKYL
ncbi:MAG: glycosyltransferase involved in cell wall biosynthesis [Patiriisocius sp.]